MQLYQRKNPLFPNFDENNNHQSDETLLRDYRSAGNPETAGILYARYMHLVYGVCLKYLKQREESRDAVMHIFEKLLMEMRSASINNFKAWLYTVTKNHCLMKIRADKTKMKRRDKWINDEQLFMESETEMHPLDEEGSTLNEALHKCLEKLKNEQKSCIELFYYQNKCYSEIALTLKLDEKKVKSHLQNGKRNLKLCLERNHEKEKEK